MAAGRSKGEKLLKRFIRSGLHGVTQTGAVIVVLNNQTGKTRIFKKEDGNGNKHAEDLMIPELKRNVKEADAQRIQFSMYSSYSPCDRCVPKLIDFIEEHPILELVIKTAGLYNVERDTCGQCNNYNMGKNINWYNNSTQGIKDLLQTPKVTIGAFEYEDWVALAELIKNKTGDDVTYTKALYKANIPCDENGQWSWHDHTTDPRFKGDKRKWSRCDEDKLQQQDYDSLAD